MPDLFVSMRKILPVALTFLAVSRVNAQTDTTLTRPKVEHEHFFGVQLNELISQFTVANATTVPSQNPYLLTYATNSKRTNWGIRMGLGLQVGASSGLNNSIGIDTSSKLFAIQWWGGGAWSHNFSEKLICSIGFDIVINYSKRETTDNGGGGIGFGDDTKTEIVTYGTGQAATLRYQFTKRIALGTEASFYYITGSQKLTINGSTDNSSQKISNGTFNLPVAIYFIIRV